MSWIRFLAEWFFALFLASLAFLGVQFAFAASVYASAWAWGLQVDPALPGVVAIFSWVAGLVASGGVLIQTAPIDAP